MNLTRRPAAHALSSRMRRVVGPATPWHSPQGPVIDMPVVFDLVMTDTLTDSEVWRVEATIDVPNQGSDPVVVQMLLESDTGLDLELLQREFRWASPLEAVTRLAPQLILRGRDPYAEEFPIDGYPDITRREVVVRRLTDEFLEDVARQYVIIGRGYAKALAERYQVTPRTVVGWIEKARARGILSSTQSGRAGGEFVARSKR
jgi:hypothetical protein